MTYLTLEGKQPICQLHMLNLYASDKFIYEINRPLFNNIYKFIKKIQKAFNMRVFCIAHHSFEVVGYFGKQWIILNHRFLLGTFKWSYGCIYECIFAHVWSYTDLVLWPLSLKFSEMLKAVQISLFRWKEVTFVQYCGFAHFSLSVNKRSTWST